ncbi:MAG: lipid-A-disaccharide synthase [Pseudomonadales bacterium]|nr:lipid-A-disaccharide synthase [Pseudomonadales bacterium]
MSEPDHSPLIALVAGELSGDNLGAPLIHAIRQRHPGARFVGIGGPAMIEAGLESWRDLDELSVNGFAEPIKRLPSLLKILLDSRDRIVESRPDCFVGIDFNFFNGLLEGMVHKRGIKVAHYVSPSVWAWRQGRIKSIAKNVDLMMTLYPFENAIYEENGVRAVFVGHPRADQISLQAEPGAREQARELLGLNVSGQVIALLPGSRGSEVAMTGVDFLDTARQLSQSDNSRVFVIPAANDKRKAQLEQLLEGYADINVVLVAGQSEQVMQAADVVLANGGTATLEALLLKRPVIMSYRLGSLTYALVSRMVKTPWFSLPNILAARELIPEFIQSGAEPAAMAAAVERLLADESGNAELLAAFDEIHQRLRRNAGATAASAVLELAGYGG